MTSKQDDAESEILEGMFEEIIKMIRQKQIKLETIVQRSIELDYISQDSFKRISDALEDYGKKKNWS